MKQTSLLLVGFLFILISSCRHQHDVDISYKDGKHYYYMDADFQHSKTNSVEHYLQREMGKKKNLSFIDDRSKARVTLDDNTKFYMEKTPGHVLIRLNKNENSEQSYHRVKLMCEGIKEVILK